MIEFKCRHCFTKYAVKDSLAGRTAECRSCGQRFLVPYTSPVVRLGDEDLAVDPDEAIAIKPTINIGDPTARNPTPLIPTPLTPTAVIPTAGSRAGGATRRTFAEYRPGKKRSDRPAEEPLIPLPPIISQLWLPIGLIVLCLGVAAYAVLENVLRSDGRAGGLILIAIGVSSLLVIALRATLRTLEAAAHTFDIEFPDAISLQTIACVSLPVMCGVLGLLNGGVGGMALAAALSALFCPLLMTLLFQLPASKGLQSGFLASIAFLFGYACSALLVAAVANVLFSVWSVNLPWKLQPVTAAVATTGPVTNAPAPPSLAIAKPMPATPSSPLQPTASVTPTIAGTQPASVKTAVAIAKPTLAPATGTPAMVAPSIVAPPSTATPPESTATRPATDVPASVAAPKAVARPVTSPLRQALAELNSGRFEDAVATVTAFQAGLAKPVGRLTDTAWIDSLHIQAVAYLKMAQPAKAAPPLQRLVEAGLNDRAIVINHAVCDIVQKTNAMRAVKNLKTFAAAHPDDELAVTLWGVALDAAATRHKLIKLDDLGDDYQRANALLERARPGQYHWGTKWISAAEWNVIQQQRASAVARIDDAKRNLREANIRLDRAQSDSRKVNVVVIGRRLTLDEQRYLDIKQRSAADRVDDCRRQVGSAKDALDRAEDGLPKPTWAMDLQPVNPELLGG